MCMHFKKMVLELFVVMSPNKEVGYVTSLLPPHHNDIKITKVVMSRESFILKLNRNIRMVQKWEKGSCHSSFFL